VKRTYDNCPKCGSGSECISHGFDIDTAYEERLCVNCDATWIHHFKFTHDTMDELSKFDTALLDLIN